LKGKGLTMLMEVNLGIPRRPRMACKRKVARKITHICICSIGKAFFGSMPSMVHHGVSEFTRGGKYVHDVA